MLMSPDELRAARKRLGISKQGLAVRSGFDRRALDNMDKSSWNPTARTLASIQAAIEDARRPLEAETSPQATPKASPRREAGAQ